MVWMYLIQFHVKGLQVEVLRFILCANIPSTCAGSFVEFLLDTQAAHTQQDGNISPTDTALVEIRYLTSYERMGKAQVTCSEGCDCEGGVIDGMSQQHFSLPGSRTFDVTQSKECVLRLEVIKGEGGEKFKILSLSVSFV